LNTPSKTVYFLGAGFSKAVADLPTMGEFIKHEDIEKEKYVDLTIPNLSKYIKENFKKNEFYNIEEIFTYIEISVSNLGKYLSTPLRYLHKVKKETERYIYRRIETEFNSRRGEDDNFRRKYENMIHNLSPHFESAYGIITLNYDRIIEIENVLGKKQKNYRSLLTLAPKKFLRKN